MSLVSPRIARSQLLACLKSIETPKILVIGDLVLDRYTWGDVPRVSPEAPVLILKADRRESRLGGAASVCGLLRGLGAEVNVVGIVGDDGDAVQLLTEMQSQGISTAGVLTDQGRSTTVKERFMGRAANRHPHQILRVDTEQDHAVSGDLESQIADYLEEVVAEQDAVLISDYDKGLCTTRLTQQIIEAAAAADIPVSVDPARGSDYAKYRGATLITPNRAEAQLAAGIAIESTGDAIVAGRQLRERFEVENVVVTLDRDGMVLVGASLAQGFPTRPRRVYDITGAGDIVLAMMGLCQAAGVPIAETIELANVAAGLEVEQVGVVPIPRLEIEKELLNELGAARGKLVTLEQMAELAENARRRGQRVVFTNGCFDLLHVGHVMYLQEAAAMGDLLVVGLNSDESIRRLKGKSRPVIEEQNRAALLAALECVDHVVIFADDTPCSLLEGIRPDVLVKGGTYAVDEVVGKEIVDAYGGKVCVTSISMDVSTTEIVKRIQQEDPTN